MNKANLKVLALVRGRVSKTEQVLTDINADGTEEHRTIVTETVIWPTLPEGAIVEPMATNPRNPYEQIWLITLPGASPEVLARFVALDLREVRRLYENWTGGPSPEEWGEWLAVEL